MAKTSTHRLKFQSYPGSQAQEKIIASLNIRSNFLDIEELTSGDKKKSSPIDEQLEKLSLKFTFKSSARAITGSPSLPIGEFYIDDLY